MNKKESLQAIIQLWLAVPEQDRTDRYFPDFYHQLESKHPELLQWRNLSGRRDREVKAQLNANNLIKLG